jgi:ribosome-associated toxin RatA of RatAB toxin-antitoxin module
MIVRRSALLALPAAHMFDVIEAAEHYPAFLPWCAGARILDRDDGMVAAELQVRLAGVNFEVRTRNPKRRPTHMAIHLDSGPFRRFEGEWALTELAPDACKVAFTLDYEFDSSFMTRAAGPVFKHIADAMVDAFVQRARALPYIVAGMAPPPASVSDAAPEPLGAGPHHADATLTGAAAPGPVMPACDTPCPPSGTTPG